MLKTTVLCGDTCNLGNFLYHDAVFNRFIIFCLWEC